MQYDALVVKGSYRGLAKEIGYADIENSRPIRDCIERLWKVSIIAQFEKKRQGYRLLAEYASDGKDGRLYVALNPRITQAIMGNAQHTRINMDEVRALRSDVARLLHQRLCGWINSGESRRVTIETLCGYAWLEVAKNEAMKERQAETTKKRRQRVRAALEELRALGWAVIEYATGKFEIGRGTDPCLTVPKPLRNCPDSPV